MDVNSTSGTVLSVPIILAATARGSSCVTEGVLKAVDMKGRMSNKSVLIGLFVKVVVVVSLELLLLLLVLLLVEVKEEEEGSFNSGGSEILVLLVLSILPILGDGDRLLDEALLLM
jgi:hypothetical protein